MFKKIFVPVDLEHRDALDKALQVAGKLARDCQATVAYAGVTTAAASSIAATPEKFAEELSAFAKEQGRKFSIEAEALALTSHDPATDLAATVLEAIEAAQADAVVMASHMPGILDHIFSANAVTVAAEASVSVFVIR